MTSGRPVPTFHTRACTTVTPPSCRTPPGPSAGLAQASPGGTTTPGFDVVPTLSTSHRRFTCVRLRSAYLTGSRPAFSSTLTTRALYPRSSRGFEACTCMPASRGPPSSRVQQGCSESTGSTSRSPLCAVVAHVESPGGISPPGAHGTGHERLRSSGSYRPAAARCNKRQWAKSPGSQAAMARIRCSERRRCRRKRLYFPSAQRANRRSRY